MGTELPKEPKELSFWVLLWIVLAVIALWVGTGFLLYDANEETPIWGNRGTFGDMFGSINALFSGLAFAGLIFTVLLQRQELQMQRHELQLQREEIVESRKELAGQRTQLEVQSKTFTLQRFEGTFFQLLPYFCRIAEAASPGGRRPSFNQARSHLIAEIDPREVARSGFETAISLAYQNTLSSELFSYLPTYFRALYNVLTFVDRANDVDKQFYVNLVRNELSEDECILLAYIGLTDVGRTKLKPLIERYRLLKHIPTQSLFDDFTLFKAYDRGAFQKDLPSILGTH